jgi:hypothetical protein
VEVTEVSRFGPWSVLVKPWPAYTGNQAWWDVRLKHKDAKGAYWLAWNGKRLARSKATKSIVDKNPELLEQVHEALQAWHSK